MNTLTLKYLKPWTLPPSYGGAHWDDWYVFLGQNRDSNALTRSNFECGLTAIRKVCSKQDLVDALPEDAECASVQVVCENHWAVGWIEWIAIHKSDTKALELADYLLEQLEDYPVLNEEHWSELEYTEACEYWSQLRVKDRVEYLQRADLCIFAARRDSLPEDDNGRLQELLTGN